MSDSRLLRRLCPLALVLMLGAAGVSAQTTGGQSGARDRGGRDATPRTPTRRVRPDIPRPLYLAGVVVFADGSPAPPNVVIERICADGRAIAETQTDKKGRFSFEVGRALPLMSDASFAPPVPGDPGSLQPRQNPFAGQQSEPGIAGLSDKRLLGCRLRAALPGHTSSHVDLTSRSDFDNPDVGTIVLERQEGVEGLPISMTSLHAPPSAREAYEKGIQEATKENWGAARKHFEKAIDEYPEFAEAWFGLGLVHDSRGDRQVAREAYLEAVAADQDYLRPFVKLARLGVLEQKWDEVAGITNSILEKNPESFPDAYYYSAIANLNLGNHAEAEHSARGGVARSAQDQYPQIEQVLGLSLAHQHDYEAGVSHLRRYLELAPEAGDVARVRDWIGKLEPLIAEQRAAADKANSSPR